MRDFKQNTSFSAVWAKLIIYFLYSCNFVYSGCLLRYLEEHGFWPRDSKKWQIVVFVEIKLFRICQLMNFKDAQGVTEEGTKDNP